MRLPCQRDGSRESLAVTQWGLFSKRGVFLFESAGQLLLRLLLGQMSRIPVCLTKVQVMRKSQLESSTEDSTSLLSPIDDTLPTTVSDEQCIECYV